MSRKTPKVKENIQKNPIKRDRSKFCRFTDGIFRPHKWFNSHSDSYLLTLLSLMVLTRGKSHARVTREDIAALAGVHPDTISRATSQLHEEGLLAIHSWRTSDGKQHNLYILSRLFYFHKLKRKIFSAIKYSLSEFVRLLKESLLTLYKRRKQFDGSDKSYSLFKKYLYLKRVYLCKRKPQRE